MNELILEEGYVQVGDGIPVYFRIEENSEWPVHIMFTGLKYSQYDLYNEWANNGLPLEKINIKQILTAGFEHSYCSYRDMSRALLATVSDYYFWASMGGCEGAKTKEERLINKIKKEFYENLYNAPPHVKAMVDKAQENN